MKWTGPLIALAIGLAIPSLVGFRTPQKLPEMAPDPFRPTNSPGYWVGVYGSGLIGPGAWIVALTVPWFDDGPSRFVDVHVNGLVISAAFLVALGTAAMNWRLCVLAFLATFFGLMFGSGSTRGGDAGFALGFVLTMFLAFWSALFGAILGGLLSLIRDRMRKPAAPFNVPVDSGLTWARDILHKRDQEGP